MKAEQVNEVYITGLGAFMPGEPVNNDQIEDVLGMINGKPSRAKRRVLGQNRITSRHYAIDASGHARWSNAQMAAEALRNAGSRGAIPVGGIGYLAAATTLSDSLAPGFASLVQGEAKLSGCEIASFGGVCASSVAALKSAYAYVRSGLATSAGVVGSELASRHFHAKKYEAIESVRAGEMLGFDAEFLRWMLSDGAGAAILSDRPGRNGLSLKIDWIDQRSVADKLPVCMYAGAEKATGGPFQKTWGDYSNYLEAVGAGALTLRQDLDLLSHIVPLGIAHYMDLIRSGKLSTDFDWFVCHFSSHVFREEIVDLLGKADATIPEEKWFSNLYTKGNVGSASFFVLLEELFHSGRLKPGQKILCMIPESARFITAFVQLTVVGESSAISAEPETESDAALSLLSTVNTAASSDPKVEVLRQLVSVWTDFELALGKVPIVERINHGTVTLAEYQLLLCNLRQQVMDGSRWIARGASHIDTADAAHARLRSLFIKHGVDEHRDYQMLERDYVATGGELDVIQRHPRNIGSDALSAWMFNAASEPNPFWLLGAMFIIEGLGNRLAAGWARRLQRGLGLPAGAVSFLAYHGVNDTAHFDHLDEALGLLPWTDALVARTVRTAKVTARLYRLQLEELGHY